MAIKDIVGNKKAKEILMMSGNSAKYGTSYMFVGEESVGKNFAAIQFAKTLNCLEPKDDGDCCDACSNCNILDKIFSELDEDGMQVYPHPDALYINTEKANIVIDMVRDKLGEINSFRQVKLKKKIVIVNDSEKMNNMAANAILKELEEPNRNVVIILLVNNLEKMLPTIISRCHKVEIKKASLKEVKEKLAVLRPELDPKQLEDAVTFCEGRIGDALNYEQLQGKMEYVKELFTILASKNDDVEGLFAKVAEIEAMKKEKKSKKAVNMRIYLLDVLKILSYIYKDVMLAKLSIKNVLEAKYGIKISDLKDYTVEKVVNIIKMIETAQKDNMLNANTNLLTTDLFFNIRKEGLR